MPIMKAPQFSLQDQTGNIHNLEAYRGKWVVVYFYPKDDTPGCTVEACNFRDNMSSLIAENTIVFGISKDSTKSHSKFIAKYNLNFALLSDETLETIKAYGAWGPKKMFGKEYDGIIRKTFIINPEGEIVKEYSEVTPENHATEVLVDIKKLKNV